MNEDYSWVKEFVGSLDGFSKTYWIKHEDYGEIVINNGRYPFGRSSGFYEAAMTGCFEKAITKSNNSDNVKINSEDVLKLL